MKVAVIVNPVAGPAWRRRRRPALEAYVRGIVARHAAHGLVVFTEGPGHARILARQAVDEGAEVVIAWGGDGTVNEVASALLSTRGALGIVPVGSGNGLARDLGIPRRPGAALAAALAGRDRIIDVGELNSRLFFNSAGVGFDAHVAKTFASSSGHVRGFVSYVATTVLELFRYEPSTYQVEADGRRAGAVPALLVVAANTRQWGNGAQIAPQAVTDDGLLDLVMVHACPPALVLANIWRLFAGSAAVWSRVETRQVRAATIHASPPAPVHVDGEPLGHLSTIDIRIMRSALRVRVPDRR